MNCNFDEILLYEYLDDLLSPEEKLLVSNHLSNCSECRKKVAEIKLLYYEIEHVEEVELPNEVAAIRASIVSKAFEDEKKSFVDTVTEGVITTVSAVVPTKAQTKNAAKGLYNGTKKIYQAIPKKEKKTKKTIKHFGGIL